MHCTIEFNPVPIAMKEKGKKNKTKGLSGVSFHSLVSKGKCGEWGHGIVVSEFCSNIDLETWEHAKGPCCYR